MRDDEKRERDVQKDRMVFSMLKDFKCFEMGEYMMEELKWILKKNDKDWKQLFYSAKMSFNCLVKMMPESSITKSVCRMVHYNICMSVH